ncbi:protein-glutamine glutaminase family protein [Halobacteriovorax sp. JY17]|uniref:protein-glutamine glutaminase family protein n=1 Tax=Halobacteriovorax sp. JY17 TaxID=2014617 RepID=UPI000C51025E|nr:protein-glutamine glutaminase family protein [Halobacteriovorax sp. JY17]PIK16405.1 MAG: hypothetical protein CES88_06605 [Halobacteriovorax sp. JY17]
MLKLLLLLFISTTSTLAYNVSIEGEGELRNCSTDGPKELFHCQNSKGEEFLIKSKDWDYVALKRDSSGKYSSVDVYNISDKDGGFVYAASFDSQSFYTEEELPKYQGPINDYINNERYLYSDFFKNNTEQEIDTDNKELADFYKKAKFEIEDKKEKVEESLKIKNFKIKLSDGQEVKCSKSPQENCPLLNCEKDSEGFERIILRSQNSFMVNMESFGFKGSNFSVPENTMLGLYDENGNELITYAKNPEGVFKSSMLVPSNFKNNPRLFKSLKEPSYMSFLSSQLKSCGPKTLKVFSDIFEKTQRDLQNTSMLQYIDLAKGILESNYINKDSIPGNACYYKGAYYAPEGYQRALELEVMSKKTISLERAQELLDQALNRSDIPWSYTYDGCYARAHLMARMFEAEGIHVDKAWLRGSLRIPGQPKGMNWGYHVAPLVYVKGENGEVQEMIIDPSISKKPITPKEWAKTMEVNFDETEQVSFPTPTNTAFYNKTSYSVTNSTPYWPEYNKRLSESDKMSMAAQTMLEYGGAPSSDEEWERWE